MNKLLKSSIITGLFVVLGLVGFAQEAAPAGKLVNDEVLLWVLISTIVLLAIVNVVLSGTIRGMAHDSDLWKIAREKMKNRAAGVLTLGLVLSGFGAQAQTDAASAPFVMGDDLFYALISMVLILLMLVFYQVNVLRTLIRSIRGTEEEEVGVVDTWAAALTDVVPIEKEESIMFEHEHDGIRELDNNLPPWWLWGFYFTIAFGPFYIGYYHFSDGPSSSEEYKIEMAEAAEAKAVYMAGLSNLIDETNVELDLSEGALASGKKIFIENCAACHGQAGEGGVGPNMTDEYWIHGGGIKNVFTTIKYGVPAKGMIPWEAQLSPGQMKEVASYIISLKGTNPPGAKEPQGEIWKEETTSTVVPVDSTAAEPSVELPSTGPLPVDDKPIEVPTEASTEN